MTKYELSLGTQMCPEAARCDPLTASHCASIVAIQQASADFSNALSM